VGLSGYAGADAWALDESKSIAETIVTATNVGNTTAKGLVTDIVAFDYKNLKNDKSLFIESLHLERPNILDLGDQLAEA